MEERVLMAGFGGQGIVLMGTMLAYAGMIDGKHTTFFPSYGAAMRGGTANCKVIVADEPIASPVISKPSTLIAMNGPSLDRFEKDVRPGGVILVNSSLIDYKVKRDDVKVYYIPVNELANEAGSPRSANMVMLGSYITIVKPINLEAVFNALPKVLPKHRHNLLGVNEEAIKKGQLKANELLS